ncbi:MAG: UPF0182 family protein [Alphaproteobacteria bacterium]|nr:UPF0182 family protein [Alphaproteobacteria bacterium]
MQVPFALKVILIGLAALIGMVKLVDWAVELLWFGELGYVGVFWIMRLLIFGLFFAGFFVVLAYFWLNARALARIVDLVAIGAAIKTQMTGVGAPANLVYPGVLRDDTYGPARTPGLLILVSILIALIAGLRLCAEWEVLLRYVWAQPFGQAEPIFGRDIGFYLFELPFLEVLQNAATSIVFVVLALLFVTYGYAASLRVTLQDGIEAAPAVMRHLALNLALFLVAVAWGYYLDRYGLLQSTGGAVYGAGYTEVNVQRPGLWLVAGATVAVAAAFLIPWLQRHGRIVLFVATGYLGILIVALGIVPWAVQSFVVEPNELKRETPFLEHNIAFTRAAFGLDRVEERSYGAEQALAPADLARNRRTIDNIRVWDWRPLSETFRQLQQIRTYYEFNDVDVDRYTIDGEVRQVMLAAREMSEDLPDPTDTWLNRHLQYTHGYGLAMSLTAKKSVEGAPILVARDLPPKLAGGLEVREPAIYYGESASDYRIVGTGVKEFDYPAGDENVYRRYTGAGGVPLDAWWKRLLFAWDQFDIGILISSYVTPRSRIQYWRPVHERVRRLAPFLKFDDDPYLAIDRGRLYWIQDAYTISDTYPYAEPYLDTYNYIRNSLKIVIDAYNGDVTFYVIEPDDPIVRTYRAALPELFRDLKAMPEGLRRHLRYPQELFSAQLAVYSTYHMTLPQVFYNREDVWAAPHEKYGGEQIEMRPYYVLMKLPGEDRLQFLLMMPLTPRKRDNMIAWMAARSDFPGYGELIAYKMSKERLIMGPMQVEAMLDQDTLISQQLSLWDQRGSRVIRGNLLVIPIERSLVYVEPVYLIAEGVNIPQLKRIIVSDGVKLAMAPTLEAALASVYGGAPPAASGSSPGAAPVSGAAAKETRETLAPAKDAYEEAERALKSGDWDAFGRAMQRLKDVLGK